MYRLDQNGVSAHNFQKQEEGLLCPNTRYTLVPGRECDDCGISIKDPKFNVMQHKITCAVEKRGFHKTRCECCGLYGEDEDVRLQASHRKLCQKKYFNFDSINLILVMVSSKNS